MIATKFYKCLGDETRLRCLMLLLSRETLCVCDLADALQSSQPKISRHLAQMRACDLVSDHREGQWVYYRIHPALASWQNAVLAATRDALGAKLPFTEDLQRLQTVERCKSDGDCP
jgi:ArsR family transcriptional regulator, arsenate/arsenite/antimonite-responsive transcriptional repressor